ncbi:MAG: 50S ribosomal protein L1 [Candidatus Marinimicrobia bacterium]|nr:50S ribosomal protein L1 [Candidatus Neomarinimicrobiota bacterium]
MKISKKQKVNLSKLDKNLEYDLGAGVDLLKECATANFDETIEVSVNLGVNPKYADQMVRGTVTLPHGTGKKVRVLVLAKGPKADEAVEAGADFVGFEEYVQKLKDGWLDVDVIITTPDNMGEVGKMGRILGPRGLMPNPKTGTVTMDITKAVNESKAGKIELRTDKYGIVHSVVGKASFESSALSENITVLVNRLISMKPSGAKGTYFQKMVLSSTMGPGIRIDRATLGV